MARLRGAEEETAIRSAVFDWLDAAQRRGRYEFQRSELESFTYHGERIPLLDTGRGIRNPATFRSTLTLMTSAKAHPYGDEIGLDGVIAYSLQAKDGGDNVKLERAAELRAPMVYFKGVREGVFVPYYPVIVEHMDRDRRMVFLRELESAVDFYPSAPSFELDGRRYRETTVKTRQHQKAFRAKVLHAYRAVCAVCRLDLPVMLDAAHIVGDTEKLGVPEVWNGLSLCAFHHRAYDVNAMGIDGSFMVHVSAEVRESSGSPMVRVGLQDVEGRRIEMPLRDADRPHADLLDAKFQRFVASSV